MCSRFVNTYDGARKEKVSIPEGFSVEIKTLPTNRITEEILNSANAVLLGTQVRYKLDKFKQRVKNKIPISVIGTQNYGLMNGEKRS